MMMLACEKCTFYTLLVSFGPAFCHRDGSPLVLKEVPACDCCGEPHSPRAGGFCSRCGAPLRGDDPLTDSLKKLEGLLKEGE
jgi:predicted amidophosphoribosyltransferase